MTWKKHLGLAKASLNSRMVFFSSGLINEILPYSKMVVRKAYVLFINPFSSGNPKRITDNSANPGQMSG